ncbi:MAG: 2-oxoacid:ferredoxin oxidoreductase subunit beta [Myxococcales bacterium]|nr:MAG: 2-oxoacid:ferredoxin oxidoreductase subunit beta [Myxococcales bacterium]
MDSLPVINHTDPSTLSKADFTSDQDVRWCPGCGDYSILAQVQRTLPELNIPRENYVFVSGIGCSSRFPYYMNTYGMHSIHGRAPAIATGIKAARPDLSVWVITGDGDSLSIGGNHFIHVMRRNVDLQLMLFNNRIYGITKGQYSPTSEQGKITKSTPMGSIDHPINPVAIALAANATFVARTIDVEAKHLQSMIKRAAEHRGTSFIEVYQNCNIFNDGAFAPLSEKASKADHLLYLEHGKPMRFGKNNEKGIAMIGGCQPAVVDVQSHGEENLLVHDEQSEFIALMLSRFVRSEFPTLIGVIHAVERPTYDSMMAEQLKQAQQKGKDTIQALLDRGDSWEVT